MKRSMFTALLAACCVALPAAGQAAPRVTKDVTGRELDALDRVRRSVWVNWFAGDTAALRRILGPELVAMDIGGAGWVGLEQTIASSARYKAQGSKLVSVSFDSTRAHRAGETVVMFSRYTIVTQDAKGQSSTTRGRATEVFVRSGGRWVHTSWQLDTNGSGDSR